MDSERIREFLVYAREVQGQMEADLFELQSGKFFTQELDEKGERVDSTKRTIDNVKGRLYKIGKMIDAYKAMQNASRS